jgi:hypothetical protein
MSVASEHLPGFVSSDSPEGLIREIARIQAQEHARVQIIGIYFANGRHFAWYLTPRAF